MSVPTIEIDLSAVTQPQPRTVGEVPVGHRFKLNQVVYLRIAGRTLAGTVMVVRCSGTWAHEYLNPSMPITEYLGPADGKAAAAGEEIEASQLNALDVAIVYDKLCVCMGHGRNDDADTCVRARRIDDISSGWELPAHRAVRRIARLAFKTGDNHGK